MFDFYEKRKLRSILYSKTAAILIFIAALFMGTSVYERYKTEREMAERRYEQMAVLNELESRAAALQSRISEIESDRGREAEIRDRFDVKKGEEQVIIIVDEEDSPRSEESTSFASGAAVEPSFFGRLRDWYRSFR